jgi:hypothetical protein
MTAFSREISVPPAAWWRQSAAALLEAERLSPLQRAEVDIRLLRKGMWMPGRVGVFEVQYERANGESVGERRSESFSIVDLFGLVLAGCVGGAVGVAFALNGGAKVEQNLDRMKSAAIAAPMEVPLRAIRTTFTAAAGQAISSVSWNAGGITIVAEQETKIAVQNALKKDGFTVQDVKADSSGQGQ